MAYIGKTPTIGNFQVCDAISVVNGQAAYTMQVGSVNVSPESANHMLVSLNGILQKPGSSYTVSGSTITFASNLVTGDVIDFIQILGDVLDLGVPSDNTVSLAKLTATGTKDATTFLRGDNTFSTVTSGLTEADQWRLTTSYSGTNDSDITTNLERNDNTAFSVLGTGMTHSSGIFTFPSTGYYYVNFILDCDIASTDQNIYGMIQCTINNSTYITQGTCRVGDDSNAHAGTAMTSIIFDVTDTANCKIKFRTESVGAGTVLGNTSQNLTHMTFIKLGNT